MSHQFQDLRGPRVELALMDHPVLRAGLVHLDHLATEGMYKLNLQ